MAHLDRFPSISEWQARMRSSLGVEAILGFDSISGGEVLNGVSRPWGRCWVNDSVLTRLDAPSGFLVRTVPVSGDPAPKGVVLLFRLAFGNGSATPQETGSFKVTLNGKNAVTVTGVRDRHCWSNDGVKLLFVPEISRGSRMGEVLYLDPQLSSEMWAIEGVGLLWLREDWFEPGQPISMEVKTEQVTPSRNWLRVSSVALDQYAFVHEEEIRSLLVGQDEPARLGEHLLLFGDIHNHTGETDTQMPCGRGTREAAFAYARDVAGLDFCCLSEHDFQLGKNEWEDLQDLNETWDQPERFVTLHGYEWTSASFGHRNVYFRERGGPFLRASPREPGPEGWMLSGPNAPLERGEHEYHPSMLWRSLAGWEGRAMTIPHHPAAATWPLSLCQAFNGEFDRLVEIYSGWGDSLHVASPLNENVQYVPELEVRRFVDQFAFGFVASSDSHDGHPGNAQGHDEHAHFFHRAGSGQVAVLADEFSREGIFDALWNRRSYAVTGGRLRLDVTLNGEPMGAEIQASALTERPVIEVGIVSGLRCEVAEIFNGSKLVHSERLTTGDAHMTWSDPTWENGGSGAYYVRVTREDGEQAWSSPIRIMP